jgi:predicted ribonuclease toxin of YeeF-YezG toxin-antitoxin module
VSKINIKVKQVKAANKDLVNLSSRVDRVGNHISSVRHRVDGRIVSRRSIGRNLNEAAAKVREAEKKLKEIHQFVDVSMDLYVKADKKADRLKELEKKSVWDKMKDIFGTANDVVSGFRKGVAEAVFSTVEGIWNAITHPIETAKGIVYAVSHPVETAKSIWKSISDSWKNDVINGDAKSRSQWFGRALGEVALAIIGTKGVDKAVKMAKGAKVVEEAGGVRVVRPETIEKLDGKGFNGESTRKGIETRGYRPVPGERVLTKDEWKVLDRDRRIEDNYPKPIVNEKNYEVVKSNPKYFTSEGEINWPPNRGVVGNPERIKIKPGTIIDRFGYEGGTFVSPYGVPYEMRALAPETYLKPYKVYVVRKPIEVQAGKIAPWFDEPGLGIQYELDQSVKNLIDQKIIGRIGK